MVKAFVPAYDNPTECNARLARHVFRHGIDILIGTDATRASLHALIASSSTKALLLMSHGDQNCICAQGGNEDAISLEDVRNNKNDLIRLAIFAWACKTSLGLGSVFHKNAKGTSGTWWGYRTTISAPSSRELGAFQQILNCIVDNFPNTRTVDDAKAFLGTLRELCESHRQRVVVSMSKSRNYDDAHETAVAFRELWQHLDGWLPCSPQPIEASFVGIVVEDM